MLFGHGGTEQHDELEDHVDCEDAQSIYQVRKTPLPDSLDIPYEGKEFGSD
jgi:hypothetical protein